MNTRTEDGFSVLMMAVARLDMDFAERILGSGAVSKDTISDALDVLYDVAKFEDYLVWNDMFNLLYGYYEYCWR